MNRRSESYGTYGSRRSKQKETKKEGAGHCWPAPSLSPSEVGPPCAERLLLDLDVNPRGVGVHRTVVGLEPEEVGPELARQRRVDEHAGRRIDGHGSLVRQRGDR